MARTENQKLKALYIAKYIMEYSDENHDFTATDIIQYLEEEHGITAERRSVYRDLNALQDVFGFDIESKQGGRFRLCSRQFEFDDLRLLAECVDAAKFISASKAKELVSMLSELCSIYQAEQLESETFVCNRAKTTQKGTLTIISKIRAAMSKQQNGSPHIPQKITFKYLKYNIKDMHTLTERRKGSPYKVSPYKLLINDGNYYLLAFDDSSQEMRTYRIDRMKDVRLIDEPREGQQAFSQIDIETYTQRVFSMFGGEEKRVSIRFINPLLDTAVDRFGLGKDVFYRPDDDRHFVVTANVEISNQFFAWICGFGKRAKIVGPTDVAQKMQQFLSQISYMYIEEV